MAHRPEHLDERGLCECDCDRCTVDVVVLDREAGEIDWHLCICPNCNVELCGLHPEVDPDALYSL